MISQPRVLGFHGCDEAVARKVVLGADELLWSENDYDWLGHGVYFWEDSPARALSWANDESNRPNGKVKQPAVVGAVIDLGNCLNLIDAEALAIVKAAHEAYMEICRAADKQPEQNRGRDLRSRKLDCEVFETLHALRNEQAALAFDTVRGFFVEGTELYPGAGIRGQDHIQICVRSHQQILGYFLPRGM